MSEAKYSCYTCRHMEDVAYCGPCQFYTRWQALRKGEPKKKPKFLNLGEILPAPHEADHAADTRIGRK